MTSADARNHDDHPPPDWTDLLTLEEWRAAVRAIGAHRLMELRPLMLEVTPSFRSSFVAHLDDTAGFAAGQQVILAMARAAHDARELICECVSRCQCGAAAQIGLRQERA